MRHAFNQWKNRIHLSDVRESRRRNHQEIDKSTAKVVNNRSENGSSKVLICYFRCFFLPF